MRFCEDVAVNDEDTDIERVLDAEAVSVTDGVPLVDLVPLSLPVGEPECVIDALGVFVSLAESD